MIMRLEQLQCLLDVAQTGSLTSTAKRLFVSQQAVSKNIKQLEEELGVTILIRTKTGVTFTDEGIDVVTFAKKILAEQDALLQSFQAKKQGARFWEKQKINIATTSAVTNVILPDIVAELISKQSLPDIRMSVMDNLDELLRKIETKESDIGLATVRTKLLPGKIAQYADIFDVEILMHDNFVVTMNKRFYQSCDTCIDTKMYGNALVKTSYDILSDLYGNR